MIQLFTAREIDPPFQDFSLRHLAIRRNFFQINRLLGLGRDIILAAAAAIKWKAQWAAG